MFKKRPQCAWFLLVLKKSKEHPVYGTSCHLSWVCTWPAGSWNASQKERLGAAWLQFYVWFLSIFCNRLALVSLWGPASTSCHKDVLPKERVALSLSIIPRSNDIMQIIHPNLSCLEMIIPLTQDWKKTVLSCSRNWTCPAGCLPWRQRGSPPVARGH